MRLGMSVTCSTHAGSPANGWAGGIIPSGNGKGNPGRRNQVRRSVPRLRCRLRMCFFLPHTTREVAEAVPCARRDPAFGPRALRPFSIHGWDAQKFVVGAAWVIAADIDTDSSVFKRALRIAVAAESHCSRDKRRFFAVHGALHCHIRRLTLLESSRVGAMFTAPETCCLRVASDRQVHI